MSKQDHLLLTARISGIPVLRSLIEDWQIDAAGRISFRAIDLDAGDLPFDETRTVFEALTPDIRGRLRAGASLEISIWCCAESRWELTEDPESGDPLLMEDSGVEVRAEAAPLSLLIGEASLRALAARAASRPRPQSLL